MEFVQTAKDFVTSKEWPKPKPARVDIWRCFAQQIVSYDSKSERWQGQGRASRSSVKVTEISIRAAYAGHE